MNVFQGDTCTAINRRNLPRIQEKNICSEITTISAVFAHYVFHHAVMIKNHLLEKEQQIYRVIKNFMRNINTSPVQDHVALNDWLRVNKLEMMWKEVFVDKHALQCLPQYNVWTFNTSHVFGFGVLSCKFKTSPSAAEF